MNTFSAQWIVPISQPPIIDGAIALEQGKIVAVGKASKIRKQYSGHHHDLGSTILLPGLVNAHTHLEYSCLRGKIQPSKNFIDWVKQIIALKKNFTKRNIAQGIESSVLELKKTGTLLVGETTNTGLAAKILQREGFLGTLFYELVGLQNFKAYLKIEKKLKEHAPSFDITPALHAPHTVTSQLLKKVKQYLRREGLLTSIHTCESWEEVEWIQSQNGPFKEIFEEGPLSKNNAFGKKMSPIAYLNMQGFLGPRVLCVHCVHTTLKDLSSIKKSKTYIALCPRSNQYTGADDAPMKKFLEAGIPLCLGTDSLASNMDLNLWNEMKALKKFFPFLTYPFILRMATLNGAKALGFGKALGSLEVGKKACFIVVRTGSKEINDPCRFLIEEAHEKITRYGPPLWANDSLQP